MKDLIIKGKALRRELYVGVACFVAAELVNTYAILRFDRPWKELFTMIGMVLALTVILYLIQAFLRIVVLLIVKTIKKLRP